MMSRRAGQTIVRTLLAVAACAFAGACGAQTHAGPPALVLERSIPLPGVTGRIDHLALDPDRRRLFVAEVGAGAVDAVDLASGRVTRLASGLSEPQGVGYLAHGDEVVVATGGDGLVRFYPAKGGGELGRIPLGDDADDVRVDSGSGLVAVGYGGGAIAVIDPASRKLVRSFAVPAHPEGFQIDRGRIFVNLPRADKVAVVDQAKGAIIANWPNTLGHFNFPMAVDPAAGVIAVGCRLPARLALFDAASGKRLQDLDACGDADDVWFDPGRRRIYLVCGAGKVDVYVRSGPGYLRQAGVTTRAGARTGVFDPALDRLYVAAPAHGGEPAAIWVLRPQ
jgi:DNA-binding beta-propeller fold protein YncE